MLRKAGGLVVQDNAERAEHNCLQLIRASSRLAHVTAGVPLGEGHSAEGLSPAA